MYSETFDYTGPIAALVYKWLDVIFGRSLLLHTIMSTIVIIVQAGIFNGLLLKNKAYDESSYLPAFLYVLLAVAVPDFMALSPQLMSLTFILLTLGNVLRRIDNQVTDELFLNSGIFLGIATMLYLPAVVFFLVFLFSFILFSTAIIRRLLLYIFGFLSIFCLCALYYYWFDSLTSFLNSFLLEGLVMDIETILKLDQLLMISSAIILIFFISIVKTWQEVRLNNFQQKVQQVLWLMFFGGIGVLMLSNEKVGHELFFFIPIVSYFWTHYFILIRRRIFRLVMPFFLIFGLQTFTVFSYQVLADELIIERKGDPREGVMVLGEDLASYVNQEMNTPCFQQQLCEQAFQEIDYYTYAGVIYKILKKADPSYLDDNLGIMNQLQFRYPFLEEEYRKTDPRTYKKISN